MAQMRPVARNITISLQKLPLPDSESRAAAIVEEIPDTEGYGGRIRIRVVLNV